MADSQEIVRGSRVSSAASCSTLSLILPELRDTASQINADHSEFRKAQQLLVHAKMTLFSLYEFSHWLICFRLAAWPFIIIIIVINLTSSGRRHVPELSLVTTVVRGNTGCTVQWYGEWQVRLSVLPRHPLSHILVFRQAHCSHHLQKLLLCLPFVAALPQCREGSLFPNSSESSSSPKSTTINTQTELCFMQTMRIQKESSFHTSTQFSEGSRLLLDNSMSTT